MRSGQRSSSAPQDACFLLWLPRQVRLSGPSLHGIKWHQIASNCILVATMEILNLNHNLKPSSYTLMRNSQRSSSAPQDACFLLWLLRLVHYSLLFTSYLNVDRVNFSRSCLSTNSNISREMSTLPVSAAHPNAPQNACLRLWPLRQVRYSLLFMSHVYVGSVNFATSGL